MKKLWIAPLFIFAGPVLAEVSFVYYGGISGGVNQNIADLEQSTAVLIIGNALVTPSVDGNTDDTTGIGQIQAGAGLRTQRFYLGAELLGQFFSGEFDSVESGFLTTTFGPTSSNDVMTESTLRLNDFELALDLKPGVYFYQDILLYARVGVGMNELELTQNAQVTQTPSNVTIYANSTETEQVYPWRLGLGIERHFTKHISVAFDYVYTHYEDISTSGKGHAIVPAMPNPLDYSINAESEASDISRQIVTLAFNYYL